MKVDLKRFEALAKLHVPNAKIIEQRLKAILEYVSQLQTVRFDADEVADDTVMTISSEREKREPIEFKDTSLLKKNCPKLEEDQVVVPLFVDKS